MAWSDAARAAAAETRRAKAGAKSGTKVGDKAWRLNTWTRLSSTQSRTGRSEFVPTSDVAKWLRPGSGPQYTHGMNAGRVNTAVRTDTRTGRAEYLVGGVWRDSRSAHAYVKKLKGR